MTGPGDDVGRQATLLRELTLGCCRMLRACLEERRKRYDRCADPVAAYDAPVAVFLSHSKRDDGGTGEIMARELRDRLHGVPGQGSFFDAYDIQAGVDFGAKIEREARAACSSPWSPTATPTASGAGARPSSPAVTHAPMVVIDAIADRASRALPYLGNVPVVRVDPGGLEARFPVVLTAVLDQLLRRLLFQALVAPHHRRPAGRIKQPRPPAGVSFLWRLPDLMDLHAPDPVRATTGKPRLLVHPGPPLATEERDLLMEAAPKVRAHCLTLPGWHRPHLRAFR